MQHIPPKIHLSPEESELVVNAQILLTKNGIISKVYDMFGQLAEAYLKHALDALPTKVLRMHPKIAKGENYEGLPYVMLDYPRNFLKDDTLAIRTFFWWGNFFSITVQLSGKSFTSLAPKFISAAEHNLLDDWYVGVNENKWRHDFTEANYAKVSAYGLNDILRDENTLKLAKKIPLTEWDNAFDFIEENFKFLLNMMKF